MFNPTKRGTIRLVVLFLVHLSCACAASDPMKCEKLATASPLIAEDLFARITDATLVEDTGVDHCRVRGYIAPQIGFEAWLPTKGWNRKLIEVGCGGYCGNTGAI